MLFTGHWQLCLVLSLLRSPRFTSLSVNQAFKHLVDEESSQSSPYSEHGNTGETEGFCEFAGCKNEMSSSRR